MSRNTRLLALHEMSRPAMASIGSRNERLRLRTAEAGVSIGSANGD